MHPIFGEGPDDIGSEESDLDALDVYDMNSAETVQTVVFTATNPAGTVSVTVLMGGQILRVELSPSLSMPESDLGAEITLIATLAQMQARAAQHIVIATLMRARGQDPAFTAHFLERTVGLPTPETVAAERQRVFDLCYSDDDR